MDRTFDPIAATPPGGPLSTLITILVALAAAAATGAVVLAWQRQGQTRQRDALQAMAARRGWSLTWTAGDFGRAPQLRLQPRGGLPWTLDVRDGRIDYAADEPSWAEGRLIATAADSLAVVRSSFGRDVAGDRAGRALTATTLPDRSETVLIEADADPARRVVLTDLAHALRRGADALAASTPAVALGPGGFRVEAPVAPTDADRIETFVDHAQELARLFGPDA